MRLDWLVIGGGIHGVHIAARLLGEAGISPAGLRIIDPAGRLLDRWKTCTETTGMAFLRSPSVHNLDLEPYSLQYFAGERDKWADGMFTPPYDRPALTLFNDHADRVIDDYDLDEVHIRGRVVRIVVGDDGVEVELSNGESLFATRIVLAIGAGEEPSWPDWAPKQHARVNHVFDADFNEWPRSSRTVLVVGGGISAAQIALRLVSEGHDVHLVSRHELREHQFDSDPGWLGRKYMAGFLEEPDTDRRREVISNARNKGSVPPEILQELGRSCEQGALQCHVGDVTDLSEHDDAFVIQLSSKVVLKAHDILLATGFETHRPGGALIDDLIESASLPCASCGYPIVDASLRWHPRIFVAGPLAELELGPTARNIAGARRAGDKLVAAAD